MKTKSNEEEAAVSNADLLKEHRTLLEIIRGAERQARRLHSRGCFGLADVFSQLDKCASNVAERVKHYERPPAVTKGTNAAPGGGAGPAGAAGAPQ